MLHPLPFTKFGEVAALGLKATLYCSRCYELRPIDLTAEHLCDRCFATTRFRCTKNRSTGNVCGCAGSVEIEPSVLLPVGGEDTLAFELTTSAFGGQRSIQLSRWRRWSTRRRAAGSSVVRFCTSPLRP